LIIINF